MKIMDRAVDFLNEHKVLAILLPIIIPLFGLGLLTAAAVYRQHNPSPAQIYRDSLFCECSLYHGKKACSCEPR